MFTTYALYSKSHDAIYIGYTSDLINRFHSHNSLSTKGYTVHYRPWEIVYVEFHQTKAQAMKREIELKSSKGRVFIREYIKNHY